MKFYFYRAKNNQIAIQGIIEAKNPVIALGALKIEIKKKGEMEILTFRLVEKESFMECLIRITKYFVRKYEIWRISSGVSKDKSGEVVVGDVDEAKDSTTSRN